MTVKDYLKTQNIKSEIFATLEHDEAISLPNLLEDYGKIQCQEQRVICEKVVLRKDPTSVSWCFLVNNAPEPDFN